MKVKVSVKYYVQSKQFASPLASVSGLKLRDNELGS